MFLKTFTIDESASDEEYLYIDILGRGTVCIKVRDESVASCYAFTDELNS